MSKILDIGRVYLKDYNARFTGREISRLLNTSPQTAINRLNDLSKLNILRIKKEGKNNLYSLDLSHPTTRQFLYLSEEYNSFLALENKELLSLSNDIYKLYESLIVFGSFVIKEQDKKSDIDLIAVGKCNKKKMKEIFRLNHRKINCEFISFSDFRNAIKERNALAIEILKKHIIFGCSNKIIDIFIDHYKP